MVAGQPHSSLSAFSTLLLVLIALRFCCPSEKDASVVCGGLGVARCAGHRCTPLAQWLVVRPQEIDLQAPICLMRFRPRDGASS